MPQTTSDYETRRLKNIEDNKRVLAELGLLNPYLKLNIRKRQSLSKSGDAVRISKPKKRRRALDEVQTKDGAVQESRRKRKSARIRGIAAEDVQSEVGEESDSEEENRETQRPVYVHRDNIYGGVEGVEPGTWWETRMECSRAGIHRPTVAGIHGSADTGAYSIALSGGYEDNIDLGECFTYTGEGGRDLKGTKANPKNLRTAPQSKDQTLTRGNLALSQSVKTGNPVRVIRGFKLPTVFAPESGYRYDGLYIVTKCWYGTGASGFGVWKFALKRCSGQSPLPFEVSQTAPTLEANKDAKGDEDVDR